MVARHTEMEPPPEDRIPLDEVEAVVRSVPGVERAKVVVNDWGAIESIHVIGDTARPAKRVVRDIESALAAKVGILVDHRRISLAQVNAQDVPTFAPRLMLVGYGLEVDASAGHTWVNVKLGRSDRPDLLYQGAAQTRGAGAALGTALAQATVRALEQAVPEDTRIEVGHLRSVREGETTIWLCTLQVRRHDHERLVAGAAVEGGNRDEAVVRATLEAAVRATEGLTLREPADAPAEDEESFFRGSDMQREARA